jgi:hypothetical protein
MHHGDDSGTVRKPQLLPRLTLNGSRESPRSATIPASRLRTKIDRQDSARIHRYLLAPREGRAKGKFLSQSNRLETDSSPAVRPIASPISVAMDSTRMLRATRTASVG